MSEIPVSKVKFQVSNSILEWDYQRSMALFERNILPKLKSEAKNLSEALDSYKEGDYESYTKLKNIFDKICELK